MSQPICMWSGPRNLSTAMMRSFGSREDFGVIDEPFFAPFLKVSGKAHPGREETLAAHETDPHKVVAQITLDNNKEYSFQKHMPHHMLEGFPLDWAESGRHFFLMRDPERVIASYAKGRAEFTLEDLGFSAQKTLFGRLTETTGVSPLVIDSLDILNNPEKMLRKLCGALNIPFDGAMLSWEKGSRPEDGAWAPYWYASVENSEGFGAPPTQAPNMPEVYSEMLAACQDDYGYLYERRI